MTFFPYDVQRSVMKRALQSYVNSFVDLIANATKVNLQRFSENEEWKLIDTKLERHETSLLGTPFKTSSVHVTFILERRPLFYLLNIVIPCALLSLLSFVVFLVPPKVGEKITLSITILLSYTVFLLMIQEQMPETSTNIPILG